MDDVPTQPIVFDGHRTCRNGRLGRNFLFANGFSGHGFQQAPGSIHNDEVASRLGFKGGIGTASRVLPDSSRAAVSKPVANGLRIRV